MTGLGSGVSEAGAGGVVVTGTGRPSLADRGWRLVFRIGFPVAVAWWRLRRPDHQGALVAVRVGGRLLLVRPSYRREWNLPGGGVRPGETPEAAARRELREEVGLDAPTLEATGVACGLWDGRRDRVHLFTLRLDSPPVLRLDGREVVAARLASAAELQTLPLTGPVRAYRDGDLRPPAAHPTPSSSTSNSRVAPGGMTPPAPRAP